MTREIWHRGEAIQFFKQEGENYKAEIIQDLPEDEDISLYRQGEWVDLSSDRRVLLFELVWLPVSNNRPGIFPLPSHVPGNLRLMGKNPGLLSYFYWLQQ